MKKLYKFYVDFGRQGDLEGLFIAKDTDVKKLMGTEVYFGEVLGKHSEVSEVMMEDMFTAIEIPKETLELLEKELGQTWSGLNPFDFESEDE